MGIQPQTPPPTSEVLTIPEAAAYLRISERTLMTLIQRGEIRSKLVGRQHRLRDLRPLETFSQETIL